MTRYWGGRPEGRARVAVTGVGGNVGQGILKALADARIASWVVGTDAFGSSAGLYLADRGYKVPLASSPEFEEAFCRILDAEKIDIALIAADAETIHLARLRDSIENRAGTRILVPDADVVERCQDKWLMAQWFAAVGLPHPLTVRADDIDGIRRLYASSDGLLVAKPRHGFASRGLTLIRSEQEAFAVSARLGEEGIVQQHIGDDKHEYTSAVLCNGCGAPLAGIVMWRELRLGTSYNVYHANDGAILPEVLYWATCLKAAGPVNFQFRITPAGPICFEINPRFSGTAGIRYLFGFNDVDMSIRHFVFGETISQPELRQGAVMRYWDEVFVPSVSWADVLDADKVDNGVPLRLPAPPL